jgi:CheY-like chemotaxis protein
MMGFADLLRDPQLTKEERDNYIDILVRNGGQLSVIIDDILDLSKVEAGHLTMEYVECDPHRIAKDVLSLLDVKAREKNLLLSYESETKFEQVVSDPIRIRQVLLNLVNNAIKFTQAGSITVRGGHYTDEKKCDYISFTIVDTGIGIQESHRNSIFEMFVQADGSMTRRFGGTGLGLSLSRKLARALGGDVTVTDSVLGKGTTFLFTFENRPGLLQEKTHAEENQKLADDEEPTEDFLKGYRILVVDDARDNQILLDRFLTIEGAYVETANNGVTAVQKALADSFDIVLMDIQMPIMDGYTATQKLREHGFKKPIIALTAHAMPEIRKKCINVGCTDHLTKPINIKELMRTITRVLDL